jgi:hypothetical protein
MRSKEDEMATACRMNKREEIAYVLLVGKEDPTRKIMT